MLGMKWLREAFRIDNLASRPKRVPKPASRSWQVVLPDGSKAQVKANTRSEARALAKQAFGLRERLPVGTVLWKGK
jgi:hypothetical protein